MGNGSLLNDSLFAVRAVSRDHDQQVHLLQGIKIINFFYNITLDDDVSFRQIPSSHLLARIRVLLMFIP